MEITQPQVNETTEITQPEVNSQEITAPQTFKVKFNHEEKEVPYDEAITLIQKGMNYDKVENERNALKDDETLKWIDEVAKEYGVSRKELKNKWAADILDTKANEYAEAQNISPELAKEFLEAKKEREFYRNQFQTIEQQKKQQEVIDNQIKEFHEAYPDVKDEDVPDEVVNLSMSKGIPLTLTYKAYQASVMEERIKTLEEQLNVKNVNDANSNSSMGSAISAGQTQQAELTAESIKAMTREERQSKMPQILAWLTKQKK